MARKARGNRHDSNTQLYIKDLEQEIEDLRKLREEMQADFSPDEMKGQGGSALFRINYAINRKVESLALAKIEEIEIKN